MEWWIDADQKDSFEFKDSNKISLFGKLRSGKGHARDLSLSKLKI